MKIGTGRDSIDVLRADCADRPCFVVGFDQGNYVKGRGYTHYRLGGALAVCRTRYMEGCPINSICPVCRTLSVLMPGEVCEVASCAGAVLIDGGGV